MSFNNVQIFVSHQFEFIVRKWNREADSPRIFRVDGRVFVAAPDVAIPKVLAEVNTMIIVKPDDRGVVAEVQRYRGGGVVIAPIAVVFESNLVVVVFGFCGYRVCDDPGAVRTDTIHGKRELCSNPVAGRFTEFFAGPAFKHARRKRETQDRFLTVRTANDELVGFVACFE